MTDKKDSSLELIESLKDNLWIDRATRAVFIDFTVYNANINLFCVVRYDVTKYRKYLFNALKLLVNFNKKSWKSKGWWWSSRQRGAPCRHGNFAPWSWFVTSPPTTISCWHARLFFIYFTLLVVITRNWITNCFYIISIIFDQVLYVLFISYYIVEEVLEIKKLKCSYFKSVWNCLDVLVIFVSCVRFLHLFYFKNKFISCLGEIKYCYTLKKQYFIKIQST